MKLEIQIKKTGFELRLGERWEDHLTESQALHAVAQFILEQKIPLLKTELEHREWRERYAVLPKEKA